MNVRLIYCSSVYIYTEINGIPLYWGIVARLIVQGLIAHHKDKTISLTLTPWNIALWYNIRILLVPPNINICYDKTFLFSMHGNYRKRHLQHLYQKDKFYKKRGMKLSRSFKCNWNFILFSSSSSYFISVVGGCDAFLFYKVLWCY